MQGSSTKARSLQEHAYRSSRATGGATTVQGYGGTGLPVLTNTALRDSGDAAPLLPMATFTHDARSIFSLASF